MLIPSRSVKKEFVLFEAVTATGICSTFQLVFDPGIVNLAHESKTDLDWNDRFKQNIHYIHYIANDPIQ